MRLLRRRSRLRPRSRRCGSCWSAWATSAARRWPRACCASGSRSAAAPAGRDRLGGHARLSRRRAAGSAGPGGGLAPGRGHFRAARPAGDARGFRALRPGAGDGRRQPRRPAGTGGGGAPPQDASAAGVCAGDARAAAACRIPTTAACWASSGCSISSRRPWLASSTKSERIAARRGRRLAASPAEGAG